jgi:hypothetical protein
VVGTKIAGRLLLTLILDLTLMYTLLSRIDQGLEPLKSNFEKHVKQVGLDEISKEAKEAGEVRT